MHLIKKVYKRIESRYYYSCIALVNFLIGIYGMLHLNYLDSPKITPFHTVEPLSPVAGITDDLWFNMALIAASVCLIIGILINHQFMANRAFFVNIFITIMIVFSFSIRELDQHHNILWIIALGLVLMAIHSPREDGGKK